jgi:hypothetical protein
MCARIFGFNYTESHITSVIVHVGEGHCENKRLRSGKLIDQVTQADSHCYVLVSYRKSYAVNDVIFDPTWYCTLISPRLILPTQRSTRLFQVQPVSSHLGTIALFDCGNLWKISNRKKATVKFTKEGTC